MSKAKQALKYTSKSQSEGTIFTRIRTHSLVWVSIYCAKFIQLQNKVVTAAFTEREVPDD